MLAYAPRRDAPRALRPPPSRLIIVGHAAAMALVMTAKMDVDPDARSAPTEIDLIDRSRRRRRRRAEAQRPSRARHSRPPLKPSIAAVMPVPAGPTLDRCRSQPSRLGPIAGTGTDALPPTRPADRPHRPALRHPRRAIRPPYPDSKRGSSEEASLRLRLSIDERGRVIAVEPVGTADPAFLAAARRHILRAWRYQPATEGGRPVASTITITLKFELDDA